MLVKVVRALKKRRAVTPIQTMVINYRMEPIAIWQIFPEIFMFCKLYSEIWEKLEIFLILHAAAVR